MDWTLLLLAIVGPLVSGIFGFLIMLQGKNTHETFNSKMDRLLILTDQAAFARGQKDQLNNPAVTPPLGADHIPGVPG